MTHTPGPWKYKREASIYSPGAHADYAIFCDRGTVGNAMRLIGGYDKPIETESNARLIAAAPELLEALETIHTVVMGTSILKEQIIEATCDSAIRKAKGE